MRLIWLLSAVLLFTLLPAQAGHTPPQVLLRVHVQTSGEGLSAMEATTIALPPQGEQIQIRTLPEVTEHDLVGAQQAASGPLRLLFDHVGQVALSAVTGTNQGRILVVMLDGYIVYAPTIDQQITDGELDIPHQVKPEVLQALQEVARRNVEQAAKR
jgi:hypothetical protein